MDIVERLRKTDHQNYKRSQQQDQCFSQSDDLQTAVIKLLATPMVSEWKDSGDPGSKSHRHMLKKYLCAQVKKAGEVLSPQFVEAIMGFPDGWTELDV